ncbi:Leucine-rich repeat neuronal protein 3 Neuronal leucine-rich repeat protein 3 [Larimichthys crocea]|uniref:Leucine-rich repeat neuronal protein 3 Neuronal leucine-rich repeat protein 3 n=1 Tax=Larimichthys crocea TaxID=215358 RepID=A0A6G0IYT9_LARCR|nr:Leucine-rich repeat neuronal protein 3 Neuronal leucine-rich repeat protein 3 [Larimichthys crocea]
MKETAVVACFLAELSLAAFVLASEGAAHCPALCQCEIRPWFSPSSIYTEAVTVDCNDLGLSALPERLPSETQVLLLQTNNIVNVEKTLDYLANITEIDLSQNNISSVSDVCLGSLPHLLSLHMEENWIQELSDSCLASLPNLQEFYINHNLDFLHQPWSLSWPEQTDEAPSQFQSTDKRQQRVVPASTQPGDIDAGRKPHCRAVRHEL